MPPDDTAARLVLLGERLDEIELAVNDVSRELGDTDVAGAVQTIWRDVHAARVAAMGLSPLALGPMRAEAAVRVWLDDLLDDRAAPEGWRHVTTYEDAVRTLADGAVELSLDYDLGDPEGRRGIHVIDWLAEQQERHGRGVWPRDGITLHTANPYGRDEMARAIERHAGRHLAVARTLTTGGKPRFTFDWGAP
jgi:hypothetical protein